MSDTAGELKAARHNGSVEPYGGQPKMYYYKPWGDKVLLPSDPWSMQQYLGKGYTFAPPVNPTPRPAAPEMANYTEGAKQPDGTGSSGEVSPDMIAKVIEGLGKAGYDLVKRPDTATESDTKLQVSPVSSSPNGEVISIKDLQ